jgi:hypothetical protein
MTVVQPSASTAGKWRINALQRAIRCDPIARARRYGRQQALRHVRHDDPNRENKIPKKRKPDRLSSQEKNHSESQGERGNEALTRMISFCSNKG